MKKENENGKTPQNLPVPQEEYVDTREGKRSWRSSLPRTLIRLLRRERSLAINEEDPLTCYAGTREYRRQNELMAAYLQRLGTWHKRIEAFTQGHGIHKGNGSYFYYDVMANGTFIETPQDEVQKPGFDISQHHPSYLGAESRYRAVSHIKKDLSESAENTMSVSLYLNNEALALRDPVTGLQVEFIEISYKREQSGSDSLHVTFQEGTVKNKQRYYAVNYTLLDEVSLSVESEKHILYNLETDMQLLQPHQGNIVCRLVDEYLVPPAAQGQKFAQERSQLT